MNARAFLLAMTVSMTGCGDSSNGSYGTAHCPSSRQCSVHDHRPSRRHWRGGRCRSTPHRQLHRLALRSQRTRQQRAAIRFRSELPVHARRGTGHPRLGPRFQRHARWGPQAARAPTGPGVRLGGSRRYYSAQRYSCIRRRARQRSLTSRLLVASFRAF